MSAFVRGALLLVLVIAGLMVIPTGLVAPSAGSGHASSGVAAPQRPSTAAPPLASIGSSALAAHGVVLDRNRILSTLRADHVPMKDVFLPNYNAQTTVTAGHVQPLYTSAPAPMGLGYFGVQQQGSRDVGTVTYSNSVQGLATFNSVNPLYLESTSPDFFTVQLNTVLTHVTVLGNTTGEYWIQNVPVYSALTQTLSIEDNIWNFSSPTAGMQTSTLYSFGGTIVAPVFYFAVGPSWHMPMPFTVRLYNNATIVNFRPTIYFNYSITAANGTVFSGSFDRAEFNSTGLVPPTTNAAPPTFQFNGKQPDPLGLLNDAEIMIGGPGGGSTTTLLGIDAKMGLWTLPNGTSKYVAVPAGSSFGTDTGETSEGIAEWAQNGATPLAVLGSGPSLLQPLWGLVGAHFGFIRTTITLTPSNAFVFANVGSTFDGRRAGWAPVPPSGVAVYQLTPGTYSFKFLLSEYRTATWTTHHTHSVSVSLVKDTNMGVYTPLWAWNDAQLAAISQSGRGTLAHPYLLDNNEFGPISPLFGEFNDFYYPVFPGIFLANTNAFVDVVNAPTFAVTYSLPAEAHETAAFGTPFSNNLGMQFDNANHIVLANSVVTGWLFFRDNPFMSNVLFWNTSNSLVDGNSFQVQSTALVISGGTHNIVWGNTFTAATTTAPNPGSILNGNAQESLQLYEDGDLVYNNVFGTPVTAFTPGFNLYTGAPQSYMDRWNVHRQPATNVRTVDGWVLSGNILGLSYQGGNFWSNYGSSQDPYGVTPYSNGGAITFKGDFVPLVPFTLYRVVFHETGLPSGTMWSVTLNGVTLSSVGSTIKFLSPNGTFAYIVGAVSGFTASPSSGAVVVNGANQAVAITWT